MKPRPGPQTAPLVHFVVPGPLGTVSGGFIYDRHMIAALRRAQRLGCVVELAGAYPDPGPRDLTHDLARIAQADRDAAGGAVWVIDGLALTALAGGGLFQMLPGAATIALIHHALADETGSAAEEAGEGAEALALRQTGGIIVTSPATRRRLADFGQSAGISVVEPGLQRPRPATSRSTAKDAPFRLLCVASLTPRKGQDVLLAALATLARSDWHLHLIGPTPDPDFAAHLRALVEKSGLRDRVSFCGAMAAGDLDPHYRAADIFVFPSHYEGFGMALTEAMAHGLPIITTGGEAGEEASGAIAETVGNAALLVPPGNPASLAASIMRAMDDPALRSVLSARARAGAARFQTWEEAGAGFIAAIDAAPGVANDAGRRG